jgi:hypothetical protein
MKRGAAWLASLGLVVLAGACGGAAAEPANAPSNEAAPSGGGATGPAVQSDVHGTQVPVPATAGTTPAAPEIAGARGELDRAERQVGTSLGDCAAACRALASMERAADHLCALETGSECSSARERVDAARQKVQASCGACAR